jgi:hypothetical protein
MDWLIHRVATSSRYKDSLQTIETEWSLLDVLLANELLDNIDAAEARHARSGATRRQR